MTKRKEPGGISQVVNEIHRPVLGKEGGQEKAVKAEERKVAEANLDHQDPSPDPSLDQSPDQSLRNVVVVDLNLEESLKPKKNMLLARSYLHWQVKQSMAFAGTI